MFLTGLFHDANLIPRFVSPVLTQSKIQASPFEIGYGGNAPQDPLVYAGGFLVVPKKLFSTNFQKSFPRTYTNIAYLIKVFNPVVLLKPETSTIL